MRSQQRAIVIASGIGFFCTLVSPYLSLALGDGYEIDPVVCAVLSVSFIAQASIAYEGYLLSLTGLHLRESKSLIAGLIVMLVLSAVLIPALGLVGAAFANLFSFISTAMFRRKEIIATYGNELSAMLSIGWEKGFCLAGVVAGPVILGALYLFDSSLAAIVLFCCGYLALVSLYMLLAEKASIRSIK